ncbi:MAG TPA: hypothetical protein DD671_07585 [Balneolaceae bacterium]|nr:hypothetical protein [Balneolaceae bacterium]
MSDRTFDLIVIGATGFTGKRAVDYLTKNAPKNIHWGIAARNPDKLSKVAEVAGITNDRCFIVDTTVKDQVEEVVKQARIIITTVGPFSLYGEEVIAACARLGTHYLDITGEVGFIKQMKEKYGTLAEESGALIIPFSGFDSVPAEMAAYILSQRFIAAKTLDIEAHYTISGGFNGGTIATMLNKFETGEYKKMQDPRLLMDENRQQLHPPKNGNFLGYNGKISRWSVPFIMSGINSKVVYKTAEWMAEHRQPYARSIAYSEHMNLGKWYNPLPFLVISLFLITLQLMGPKKWFRAIIRKLAPDPGEGPSEHQIEHGFFRMIAFAEDHQGKTASVKISYPGDPGNKSTIFFLCESALLLASKKVTKKGFLTPVSAFEHDLVDHLNEQGLTVESSEN